MSNFSFLSQIPEYSLFAPACVEAEKIYASAPALCAVGCRKAMELAIKWVYAADQTMKIPYKDNLKSLVFEPSFRFAMDYNTWGKPANKCQALIFCNAANFRFILAFAQ